MPATTTALYFDAWLRPHRSLTRRGLALVLALAAVPSFGLGLVFLSLGAWPVTGFLVLDVSFPPPSTSLWLSFPQMSYRQNQPTRLFRT